MPASARSGEVIMISTMISHRMETGLRRDQDTGEQVERLIINSLAVTFNGKQVFATRLYPAVAANPYIAFHFRVDEAGEFIFTWTDDRGESWTQTRRIEVQ